MFEVGGRLGGGGEGGWGEGLKNVLCQNKSKYFLHFLSTKVSHDIFSFVTNTFLFIFQQRNKKEKYREYRTGYDHLCIYWILAVFRIRISLTADPDPGFYLNAYPDLDFGFRIPDPDLRSFLHKN